MQYSVDMLLYIYLYILYRKNNLNNACTQKIEKKVPIIIIIIIVIGTSIYLQYISIDIKYYDQKMIYRDDTHTPAVQSEAHILTIYTLARYVYVD